MKSVSQRPPKNHSYSKQEVLELPNRTQLLSMNMQMYAQQNLIYFSNANLLRECFVVELWYLQQ